MLCNLRLNALLATSQRVATSKALLLKRQPIVPQASTHCSFGKKPLPLKLQTIVLSGKNIVRSGKNVINSG